MNKHQSNNIISNNSLLHLLPINIRGKVIQGLDRSDLIWLRDQKNQLLLVLYYAYLEARKGGKRITHDEHSFEINEYQNLVDLAESIKRKAYEPSRSAAHIIRNPVIREIFAAPFRDRIVHHLIFNAVYDWWDDHFIYDSYSCRMNKGVLFGIKRLGHHIRSVSQRSDLPAYVMKLDIQGYFMSLPRKRLYKRAIWGLDRQYQSQKNSPAYKLIKYLWQKIIFDDPVKGVVKKGKLTDWDLLPRSKSLFSQPDGRGIVIGNLTCQLLSNVYLDQLDQFVTKTLGYKHYGRYVDDFYIVVDETDLPQLKRDKEAIKNYLRSIGLTLHPNKCLLRKATDGIPFLGAIVNAQHAVPGHRLKRNIDKAFSEVVMGKRDTTTVSSYLGHAMHINSYNYIRKAFEKVGWEYTDDEILRLRNKKPRPK